MKTEAVYTDSLNISI